ncbi:MAG: bax protein [Halomonadaceae bacterium]|nr:MAG: bax protein [Halomonadaceae bacterium]
MPRIVLVAGLILLLVVSLITGWSIGRWQLHPEADTAPEVVAMVELPDWANTPLPDFSQYQVIDERKEAFFDYLFPRIVLANKAVLDLREHLRGLQAKDELTAQDLEWLQSQADRLRVPGENGSNEQMKALALRLDVVAPSLMLAQAANESSWGTSRFATRGNNLFGQWCWTEGCGHVPERRPDGARHEVAHYDYPYRSIRSYIANLNRHEAYGELRDVRAGQRQAGDGADGLQLAEGLESYSERGTAYVREIQAMINFNQLSDYDAEFRRLLASDDLMAELDARVADYEARFNGADPD